MACSGAMPGKAPGCAPGWTTRDQDKSRPEPTLPADASDGKALRHHLDPDRLVFIDETRIKTNMTPIRGWGPKGKRLRAFAQHGHWRRLSFLGALRCDRLTAPCVFDGPINGQCFIAYVEQQLVHVLKPGDIVITDNLGSHKAAAVRQAIQAAGTRLWFLPPYSPDLNPIEQACKPHICPPALRRL